MHTPPDRASCSNIDVDVPLAPAFRSSYFFASVDESGPVPEHQINECTALYFARQLPWGGAQKQFGAVTRRVPVLAGTGNSPLAVHSANIRRDFLNRHIQGQSSIACLSSTSTENTVAGRSCIDVRTAHSPDSDHLCFIGAEASSSSSSSPVILEVCHIISSI